MDFTKAPGFGERFTFPENVAITINGAEISTIREAAVRMAERWEDAVVSEIVKEAQLAGYTEVTVLNKPFILDALREKMERENPEPLTVDELQQMHGEPVWIEFPDPDETCPAHWRIHDNNIMGCEWKSYGTHWLAYRHKKAGKADSDPGCIWCAPGHEVCGTCARFFGGQAGGCATEPNDEKCAVYVPADHCMKCGRKLRLTVEDEDKQHSGLVED